MLPLQVKGAMIARIFSSLFGAAWDERYTFTSPFASPLSAMAALSRYSFPFTHHAVRATYAHCRTTVKSEAVCFY
ncbi:hypothetical protein EGK65_10595 [Citrobacter farmeri]|nr:hypothetical protein EGK65_10595 [Citrobacter farmeri]